MLRAIVFVPPSPDFARWSNVCAAYCLNQHYAVVAVTQVWSAAVAMLASGQASVAVIAKREHLSHDQLPRLEVVAEAPAERRVIPPTRRRTRRRI